MDKHENEIIHQIVFAKPEDDSVFNFEKVCKRTHLDIASVNTACFYIMNIENEIEYNTFICRRCCSLSKYLEKTCEYLMGKGIRMVSN